MIIGSILFTVSVSNEESILMKVHSKKVKKNFKTQPKTFCDWTMKLVDPGMKWVEKFYGCVIK